MKIQFLPKYGCEFTWLPLFDEIWRYGEVKDIPDGKQILRAYRRDDGKKVSEHVNVIDALLTNINFKLAETGVNPYFTCDACGEETLIDYYQHPKMKEMVENDFNGKRYCKACFDKAPKRILPTTIIIEE